MIANRADWCIHNAQSDMETCQFAPPVAVHFTIVGFGACGNTMEKRFMTPLAV
jgi:hypothetical protein